MRATSAAALLLAFVHCGPAPAPPPRTPPRRAATRPAPAARRPAPIRPPRLSPKERQRIVIAMWEHTKRFRQAMMIRKDRKAGLVEATRVVALVERMQGRLGKGLIPWLEVMAKLHAQLNQVSAGAACLRRVLAIERHHHGATHKRVAITLNALGIYHYRRSSYPKAMAWYRQALAMNRRLHGPSHPEVAAVLNNQAAVLLEQGAYGTALRLLRRAHAIEVKVYGARSIKVATGLHNLAATYGKLAQYKRAVALYRRTLALEEKHRGRDHVSVASTLESLGSMLRELGDPLKARPLLERAVRIKRAKLGAKHASTARALLKLGRLHFEQGSYGKAERLYRGVLAIDTAVFGAAHPEVALDLTHLAALADQRGDYERGERLHLRAFKILLHHFGRKHPQTVTALHNLANHYQERGDYERAMRHLLLGMPLVRQIYGENHPHYATALSNLAIMYRAAGKLRDAHKLMIQSLRIRRKVFGEDHLTVADALSELVTVLSELGRAKEAAALGRRALAILEKRRGTDHADVARLLNDLAGSVEFAGRLDEAERMFRRALTLRRKMLGSRHPGTAALHVNLGSLLLRRGRIKEGWRMLLHGLRIRLDRAERVLPVMSERPRGMHVLRFRGEYRMLMKAALELQHRIPDAAERAFAITLRYKGLLLSSLRQERALAASAREPRIRGLLEQRDAALRWLNRISMQSPARVGPSRHKELVAKAEELFELTDERLGRALLDETRRSRRRRPSRGRRGKPARPAPLKRVLRSLRRGEALVEYVVYRRFDYRAKRYDQRWLEERYAAFVVRPGARRRVTLLDLGALKKVDRLTRAHLDAVRRSTAVSRSRGVEFALGWSARPARALHDQVVLPLTKALRGVRRLWVSPDGTLGLVPLHALPDAQGRRWGDRVRLSLLDSGRDLPRTVRPRRIPGRLGAPVALVAPSYGPAVRGRAPFHALTWSDALSRRLRGSLKALRRRSRVVRRGARVELLTGDAASESRLRRVKRPLVLHLYTHGFYLPPPTKTAAAGAAVIYLGNGEFLTRANPMRQSGVALAQANRGFARTAGEELLAKVRSGIHRDEKTLGGPKGLTPVRSVDASGDDGILTAEEAGLLDLRGTRLVVLGACQTGVGETRVGQGVYGLRRALLYAGARSLLVSLWKVPEAPTRELLFAFYAALARGQSRHAALKRARAVVRKKHPLPYYWAGFVLVGDPGPIR